MLRLIAVGAAQSALAIALAWEMNTLFAGALENAPITSGGVAGVCALVAAVSALRYMERVDGERLGQAVVHRVRGDLANHLVQLPPITRPGYSSDAIIRFVGDVAALRNWYGRGLVTITVTLPIIAAGVLAISWLDWRIGAIVMLAFVVTATAQFALAPGLRKAGREARSRRKKLIAEVTERADALASVQLFGRSRAEARRVRRRSGRLASAMVERARWSGLQRVTAEWLAAALPLLMLIVWSTAEAETLDVGVALTTLSIGGLLSPRVREIGRLVEYHTMARLSLDRISAFLRRETLDHRAGLRSARRRGGRLKLKHICIEGSFTDFSAKSGERARIALVGPNGAGKSRLLNAIAGLEEPKRGRIVLDGQNMSFRSLRSFRKLVALAGENTPLLTGTVDSNIFYGARLDGAQADELLEFADYGSLVASLPEGGQTRIGPGGRGLSVGQQRRIILIRSLMRRPVVLLLDEIESGLDEDGVMLLERIFEQFDGSIIMATHSEYWRGQCRDVWSLKESAAAFRESIRHE